MKRATIEINEFEAVCLIGSVSKTLSSIWDTLESAGLKPEEIMEDPTYRKVTRLMHLLNHAYQGLEEGGAE